MITVDIKAETIINTTEVVDIDLVIDPACKPKPKTSAIAKESRDDWTLTREEIINVPDDEWNEFIIAYVADVCGGKHGYP